LVGQVVEWRDLGALVMQGRRTVGRGGAVDRAVLLLAVMHLAGLLRKPLAHVLGVLDEMLAQFPQLGAQLPLLRRDYRDRRRRLGSGRGDPLGGGGGGGGRPRANWSG